MARLGQIQMKMLLKDIIYKGIDTISMQYPQVEAREMVFAYMEDVFGIRRHDHILEPDRILTEEQAKRALRDFERMASGEPLQYVTGKAHFYGRQFHVTPDVLIPRQETELLCSDVLLVSDSLSGHNPKILDLCTGSGCIAWTFALEMPGTQVTAVDISEEALKVASSQDFGEELSRTGALKPIFIKADVLKGPESCLELYEGPDSGQSLTGSSEPSQPVSPDFPEYDIIVSNPPYVMDSEKASMRTNVLDHEPHLALFVPDDDPLKFYRAVAVWTIRLLKEDGIGIVEINEALGKETAEIFSAAGFKYTEIIRDLHEKERFVRFSKVPFFKKNRFF